MSTGVVVMAYGSPVDADDLERYYTHIRRGRPPTAEQLAELRSRYNAIGGISPLRAVTDAQTAAIASALGDAFVVTTGLKHAPPFIEDAVASFGADVDRVVGVVLAPHDSEGSIGEYEARLQAAATVPVAMVRSWHDLSEWRAHLAAAVRDGLAVLPAPAVVVFTAHSLPERVLADDPYVEELEGSAAAIASLAGVDDWRVGWQSAARTPEPWRGPDISDVITEIAAAGAARRVLVCPQGFTADHLEVLYDLDVVAAKKATEVGLAFARTPSINADPVVMGALAERVRTTQ
jgi:ferrochelatase